MNKLLPVFTALLLISQAYATHSDLPEDELLEPDKAFSLSTRVIDGATIEARWAIAKGYYMYRDRFKFEAVDDSISLAEPVFPEGKKKEDPFFGTVEIYTKDVTVQLPIVRQRASAYRASLRITAQGCNEPVGVCYPPIVKQVSFEFSAAAVAGVTSPNNEIRSLSDLKGLVGGTLGDQEFLHPDQAFVLSVERVARDALLAHFLIADGYYLYRHKTRFELTSANAGPGDAVKLGAYKLPKGKVKVDEFFGETEVYYNQAEVALPVAGSADSNASLILKATYQGCAEKGICYPPITKRFDVQVANAGVISVAATDTAVPAASPLPAAGGTQARALGPSGSEPQRSTGTFLLTVIAAFGTGLLLTFTPCVLPMIPILSSVIVGQADKNITKSKAGILSLTYVLGTAVTYTGVGIMAGVTGDQLQSYFQNVWAIGILSAVFVAMALSMFGFYELQMPSFIQSRLQQRTQAIKGGSLAGVFVLGLVSALIVGACVSPLLFSALSVAIASRDPVLGGAMMFSMALGMGVILVAAGVGAGALLPKAGAWMERVKQIFGVLLLAVAIYLLGFVPEVPVLFLWSALFIVVAVYLGATQNLPQGASSWRYLWKGGETLLLIWGVLALLGGLAGNRDVFRPLPISAVGSGIVLGGTAGPGSAQATSTSGSTELFERLTSLATIEERLAAARVAGKPVMLDYYADWCIECLRMENTTFADRRVREALDDFVLLQADVTDAFDPEIKHLKQRFGVYGPPATLFFAASGEEIEHLRFYGFRSADALLEMLRTVSPPTITASKAGS
ncbi:MAG: protein-disulfide reductase DsbD [Acidiferrobacterales bacterium]